MLAAIIVVGLFCLQMHLMKKNEMNANYWLIRLPGLVVVLVLYVMLMASGAPMVYAMVQGYWWWWLG